METTASTDSTAGAGSAARPFAVVTGASTGIGFHLARCCAEGGFDLLIAADEPEIENAARTLQATGAMVTPIQVDLATPRGVDTLYQAAQGRPIDALLANAGRGLGRGFLEQDFKDIQRVIETNVTGTIDLIHRVGKDMLARRQGRILITGSIAGFMPGTYQAVYNASKAFLDSFSFALRHELLETGVSVTCLMPGATETEFFERADMLDTKIATDKKSDPADVARSGFEAMMRGDSNVIVGWQNKLQAAIASVSPADLVAERHRQMAQPGTAR